MSRIQSSILYNCLDERDIYVYRFSVLHICASFQQFQIGEIAKSGYAISRKVKKSSRRFIIYMADIEEPFATLRECAFAEVHLKIQAVQSSYRFMCLKSS